MLKLDNKTNRPHCFVLQQNLYIIILLVTNMSTSHAIMESELIELKMNTDITKLIGQINGNQRRH
jgi:hypothetical protein